MPALPFAPARRHRGPRPLLLSAAVALAYAGGHLAWYRETPLGEVPVLDEQENIALAEAIATGALPAEPFYRAPGYALLLALIRSLGVPAAQLFQVALFLGVILHALNATLVARLSGQLFAARAATLIAGLLYALHPVFVHYSTQALDAVPALTLFLLGLVCVVPEFTRANDASGSWPTPGARPARWLAASLSWAAATMFRPNYLLVWAMLPLLAFWSARGGTRWRMLAASAAGATLFLAVATWQSRLSGVAGFLPWQGPYNLWAANRPGTHGRYHVQRQAMPAAAAKQNPARTESFELYRLERGAPAANIRELNAHWRTRFWSHVVAQPSAWLVLLARKMYALLNSWEQYNNKTFAFHQARSPWLKLNPLTWGVILMLAVAGAARLWQMNRPAAMRLGGVVAATTASVVLFFVSARFRLPLAAIGVALAGGAVAAPRFWTAWSRQKQIGLAAGLAVAAAITSSSFDNVRDRATFVQDHVLLARAAHTVGDDILAWHEATAALRLQPTHPDALRIAVTSYFNQLLSAAPAIGAERVWREHCARLINHPPADTRDLRPIAAMALWRAGQTEAACNIWRALGEMPSAVSARLLVGDVPPAHADPAGWHRHAWDEPLVRLAALRFGLAPPEGVQLGERDRASALVEQLFLVPKAHQP